MERVSGVCDRSTQNSQRPQSHHGSRACYEQGAYCHCLVPYRAGHLLDYLQQNNKKQGTTAVGRPTFAGMLFGRYSKVSVERALP